jgi:hypothetical protein
MNGPYSFTDRDIDFGLFWDIAASCDHSELLEDENDSIQCARCLSCLVMVPNAPGEFRLEWLSLSQMGQRRRQLLRDQPVR